MNKLAFLSKVTVAAVEPAKKTAARTARQYQPLTADLRIWNTGAIFPSAELISKFNLEYVAKDATEKGNGIDIIDSRQMPAINSETPFIGLSFTPKDAGKVDIFSQVSYAEDGSPKTSVAEQGAVSFGKEVLLPLLKEVYEVEPNEEGFIDLVVVTDPSFESPNGIYQFPKIVSRGERKGEITYTRRENQTVYAVVPSSFMEGGEEPVEAENSGAEIEHPSDPFVAEPEASPFENAAAETATTKAERVSK